MASPRRKSPTTAEVGHEMERYFKYLFYKMTQVVVQSRQGDRTCTPSSAVNNLRAWFTLAIQDIAEINYEAKRIIQPYLNSGQGILVTPLCIEISLKTAEGDSMVLETWVLSLKDNIEYLEGSSDDDSKSPNIVYNHMGMLMKSLICVSRALPAYKLSRRQGPDSFVICYRLYSGEPLSNLLGEGQQTCPIGQVSTSSGTLFLRVDYRSASAMTIDPRSSLTMGMGVPMGVPMGPSGAANPILLQRSSDQGENRFYRTRSDTFGSSNRISDDSEQAITSDESSELRIFASSPPDPPPHLGDHHRKFSDEDCYSDRIKFGAFSTRKSKNVHGTSTSEEDQDFNKSDPLLELFTVDQDDEKHPTDKPAEDSLPPSKPLLLENKLSQLCLDDDNDPLRRTKSLESVPASTSSPRLKTTPAFGSARNANAKEFRSEDFEFLDFKAPFSAKSAEANSNDLGVFFKDVQHAAILKTIAEETPSTSSAALRGSAGVASGLESQLQDLNEQLMSFESNLAEYDEMLKTLETSESESDVY